ncbi:MAG TPA: hypothetical protein VFQ53_06085 [Kofleriaceae bacterium]|nr:hypothetical protein [Kofleriaceae bacterium]
MTAVTTLELRSAAEVSSWVAAGLCLRRVPTETDEDATIGQAILACASELGALPPAGVIADVAVMLGGARLPQQTTINGDDGLKSAIRAYEDDVLSRLAQTARFDDVLAAFAHLGPALRPTAIALVVGALCERAGFAGLSVSPATLRRALARPREERDAAGRAELKGGAVAQTITEAYQRLARGARQSRALVDDREVFAIDHLEVLGSFGRRLAADHIGAAAAAISGRLPRRLPAKREQRGVKDTQLADDTLYPAGGFTAITPSASANIENLVSSELVYMEDGGDVVDLFTLRYVEGELLYYTRDDSVFRRHRHVIVFALGADLEDARIKDKDLPWQRLVLALGMMVAAIRWLTEQLGHEALSIHLAFPPRLLAPERELVELLLEGEVKSGIVKVVEQPWEAAIEVAQQAKSAISDLVVVSLGSVPALPKGQRALHLALGQVSPQVYELAPRKGAPPDPDADPWTEWCEDTEDLLRWLV